MKYVAYVKDDLVTRVILVEDDYGDKSENTAVVGEENTVGIGWTYKDGKFSAPEYIPEE